MSVWDLIPEVIEVAIVRAEFVLLFEISPAVTEGHVPAVVLVPPGIVLEHLGGLDEADGAARTVAGFYKSRGHAGN